MGFVNYLALSGLVAIPIIVIMYLLKQKAKEQKVPSLYLWKRASEISLAQKPWQKLKRNLLMFLQILIAFLITMALANPYFTNQKQMQNYIFVLDNSLSMQATDVLPNRFEAAREEVLNIISTARSGSKFSIIESSTQARIVCSYVEKGEALEKLGDISVTSFGNDDEKTRNLVSILKTQTQAKVIVVSDRNILDDVETIAIGNSKNNVAITMLSHLVESDRIISLAKVENFGDRKQTCEVGLYADGVLQEIKEAELLPNQTRDVFFTNVNKDAEILNAKLLQNDFLEKDNTAFDVVNRIEKKKVVLVSDGNIFLEKALSLLKSIELYKAAPSEVDTLSGFYLYIYDGITPKKSPTDGNLLVINPPIENSIIKVLGESQLTGISKTDKTLFEFIDEFDFAISKSKTFEATDGAVTHVSGDEQPIMVSLERNQQKIMAVGFDLHNTDLPLKKEFPIFMYNIISWFVPEQANANVKNFVGQPIELNILPNASEVSILYPMPSDKLEQLNLPVHVYSDANEQGIYSIIQRIGEETKINKFAVNLEPQEFDISVSAQSTSAMSEETRVGFAKSGLRIFLIVLILLIIFGEWWVFSGGKILKQRTPFVVMRAIVIFVLILSMFGFSIKSFADTTTTMIVMDISDSADIAKAQQFVLELEENRTDKDLAGLIVFGKKAVIDSLPQAKPIQNFTSKADATATNIEEALLVADGLIPSDSKKRILLISDGRENIGDSKKTAKLLQEQNTVVDVYYTPKILENEVQLKQIKVPKRIKSGSAYNIEVTAQSLKDTFGELQIFKNDVMVFHEEVKLVRGENNFTFSDKADIEGGVVYRAVIMASSDSSKDNNISYAYSNVSGRAKVLIIENEDAGRELENIFGGVDVVRINSNSAPTSIQEYNKYDAVILADMPIDALPTQVPLILNSYVKDLGGGLLVFGGENSFMLGGYLETPIEEMLPVDMELKDKSKTPDLGMIICLDRSGSMSGAQYGIQKLAMAKESVIRSLETLNEKDRFGVIAFDDTNNWISEFMKVEKNRKAIENRIAGITLGGGTSILPSLDLAVETLQGASSKIKHIILLTDGQAEQQGYMSIIDRMKDSQITLSTVAVGSDADTNLLQSLAKQGDGRYYFVNEFSDLPKVFADETRIAGKTILNNETFYPKIEEANAVLDGIKGLPTLSGYVSTTAKTRANVLLTSEKDEPILATWQYGLGNSAAWMSDSKGLWTKEWLASEEGISVFRNLLSWCLRKQNDNGLELQVKAKGDFAEISAHLPYSGDVSRLSASIISNGKNTPIEFKAVSPSDYVAKLDNAASGVYVAQFSIEKSTGTDIFSTGFSINYSAEYELKTDDSGKNLLTELAQITNGKVLESPRDAFYTLPDMKRDEKDVSDILLWIALALFVADVAIRRFPHLFLRLVRVPNFKQVVKKKAINDETKKSIVMKENVKISKIDQQSTTSILLSQKKKRDK